MPDLKFEDEARAGGCRRVAGVDEAGRGPLAGPVAAAAVVLPEDFAHEALTDSKKLKEAQREALFEELTSSAEVHWAVALVEVAEIEAINILRATHVAMGRAVAQLVPEADFCLIDGLPVPGFALPSRAVVKGDGLSLSIAAASIVAKVTRDRCMREYARQFPEYGFEKHKGYGTKAHLEALHRHGPCRIHRKTFQPVAELTVSPGQRGG
ncbi:MAG: ribonuclease HII [Akkermansiaceae bacterium]|nr:ribonuclease HII [Akkermansiaceae bacterium]NNM30295.1 ribonuclease HII [Akkermansiaceae bacterium]